MIIKESINDSFYLWYNFVGDIMDLGSFNFKKSLGQNFLVDNNILNKIIIASDIKEDSLVIEIGCGSGNLTKKLCEKASYVLGYEIDKNVEDYLMDNLKDYDNYKIIFGDFLKHDLSDDIKRFNYKNIYVVANVPYYITTPIIEKIIESKIETNNIVLMVQKEVGDRFSSKPGTKDYGSITVFLNYFYDVKKLFIVNKNSFLPKPKVDSVVISLKRRDKIRIKDEELFFKLIKDSFRFRRKNIRNNLKEYDLKKIEEVLKKYGYDLNVRSEELSLEIFSDISNTLSI